MKHNILLYHWAPKERFDRILRVGLSPKSKPRIGEWRAPYICLSDSPSLAWVLVMDKERFSQWDLWMVWSRCISDLRRLPPGRRGEPTEFRAFQRIPKRWLWHVGTKTA